MVIKTIFQNKVLYLINKPPLGGLLIWFPIVRSEL